MYEGMIEEAKREGIGEVVVSALIRKGDDLLVIEDLMELTPIYTFPHALLKQGETIQQALQRGIMESTLMNLERVVSLLGHYDLEGKRYIYFIAEVSDPYAVEGAEQIAYAWIPAQEAAGYPITNELREMINRYLDQD